MMILEVSSGHQNVSETVKYHMKGLTKILWGIPAFLSKGFPVIGLS